MTIRIQGFNSEDQLDEVVTSIDVWYDRHTRLWVIQKLNKEGYQIDSASYVYGKKLAMQVAAELKEQYGLA